MDFEDLKNFRNSTNYFAKKLGIEIEAIGYGYARAVKTISSEDINLSNSIHCGIFFTLADVAADSAVSTLGYQSNLISSDFHQFYSGDAGDVLIAEAQELQSRKNLYSYAVRITNQDRRLLYSATFTYELNEQKLLSSLLY